MEWYEEQCDHLGGKMLEFCENDSGDEEKKSICYVEKYDYYTYENGDNLKRFHVNKKMVIAVFIIFAILTVAIAYPIMHWEAINTLFYEAVVFFFIMYGSRILKSNVIIMFITVVFGIAFVILIISNLMVTGEWYPLWVEIYAHILAGFAFYACATIIMPKSSVIRRYLLGFGFGVLYEVFEFIIFTTMHMPNLLYEFNNSFFDLFNNTIGACIAVLIEYVIRRKDRKYYGAIIENTDCF